MNLWNDDEAEYVDEIIDCAARLISLEWEFLNPPPAPLLKPAHRAAQVNRRMAEIGKRAAARNHQPIPPGVAEYRRRQEIERRNNSTAHRMAKAAEKLGLE